jgi:hypothetical protein
MNMDSETVILTVTKDFNLKTGFAKMVPKHLSGEQSMRRKESCSDLIVRLLEEPNSGEIILTGFPI